MSALFDLFKRVLRPEIIGLPILALSLVRCSSTSLDCSSIEGKSACIDEINIALTEGNCGKAIHLVNQLYNNSDLTDNQVRTLRASAYACRANINFFVLMDDLADNAASFCGLTFWSTVTQVFAPKSPVIDDVLDTRQIAGWTAMESLFAVLRDGSVVRSAYEINSGTANKGSTNPEDTENDANLFKALVSMSIIGNAQNRYGDPTSTGAQTVDLPWTTQDTINDTDSTGLNGCAYASAYIHLVTNIDSVADAVSNDSVRTALQSISSVLRDGVGGVRGMSEACGLGCRGRDMADLANVDGDCTYAADDCNPCDAGDENCIQCPIALRDRNSCQSDVYASCAGAGLVRLMNLGWQN